MTGEAAVREIEVILDELRMRTQSDRVTVRIDCVSHGWHVDRVLAEVCHPGVNSLLQDDSISQRTLATVQYLERTRTILVQPDVRHAVVRPPDALVTLYGVKAQMLGPIEKETQLVGWVSVHDTQGAHPWSEMETDALREAVSAIGIVLDSVTCSTHP